MVVIEALKTHNRENFDCEADALNRYLRERATQDIKRRLNRVFIIREVKRDQILGYYTLAATTIEVAQLPPAHAKHLLKYPIPAALLGKLAVDKTWKNKGVGKLLVADALRRVQAVEKEIGIHVLVVDPIHDALIGFYTQLGFLHIPPEKRLFLFVSSLLE